MSSFLDKIKNKPNNNPQDFQPMQQQNFTSPEAMSNSNFSLNNQPNSGMPGIPNLNESIQNLAQNIPNLNPNMGGQQPMVNPMGMPNLGGQQPQQPMGNPNMPNMNGQQPLNNPNPMGMPNLGGQQQPQQPMNNPNPMGNPNMPNMNGQQPMNNPNPMGNPNMPNMNGQQPMNNPNPMGNPNMPNMGGQQPTNNPNPMGNPNMPNMGGQQPTNNPNPMGMPNIGGQQPMGNNQSNPFVKPKNMDAIGQQAAIPQTKTYSNMNEKKISPEYYGKLRPYFENNGVNSIHMYGHEIISFQINGEDTIGQPIFESEDELIDYLESVINWNDKDPHKVNLRSFRETKRTFGTFYMQDLSRLHIAITEEELYATIAVKRKDMLSLEDLCNKFQMFDDKVKNFLYEAVRANAKIIVAGQGGAGKSTFIQALGNVINPRNVTLVAEEYRELILNRPNVKYVSASENRPLHKIVAESTKMRIRNLIVGEVIADEALGMLEAMNTGLDVVLATTHANGAYHAMNRLITLACRNQNMSAKYVKNLIGENVDLIVFIEEINGKKMISEILGIERYQEEIDRVIGNHLYDFKNGKVNVTSSTASRIHKKIDAYKKRERERMNG